MNKNRIVIISVGLCIVSLILPFLISSESDSLMDIVATAFAALAAVATVLTLFVAILLYQKFGIESRFIERQTDKVLELVDLLKGKQVSVITDKFIYYLRFTINEPWRYRPDYYTDFKDRILLFHKKDYLEFINPILELKRSYWLPNEIKDKMAFFEIAALQTNIDDFKNIKYTRFKFLYKKGEKDDDLSWDLPLPSLTVDEYIKSKNILIKGIENWLSEHSDIKLDLKMDEPNQNANKFI